MFQIYPQWQGFFITSLIMLCLLPLTACSDSSDKTQAGMNMPEVSVVTIQPQRLVMSTELPGRVSALQISEVRPQVSGIIQKRLFTEGADVKAGDTLYQIDPATYQADLDSAKANLARAEANVLPARLKMQRFKQLVDIRAVSRQDFEDAEAAYKQTMADVGVNRAALENARIRLKYTKVTAPISGRIGRSQVTPGALVTENQATPLTTVQQLDTVYVDVTQSSAEVLRLKRSFAQGQVQRMDQEHAAVRLLLEDGSTYDGAGALQFTDISVDESTGMVTLRALFPNPQQDLLPGMYVRAVLSEGVNEQALLLPQVALVRDAKGNPTTYVLGAGDTVEIRSLRVGRTSGDSWIVQSGLQAGDRVIVGGLQKIRPGMKVRVLPSPAAPESRLSPAATSAQQD